MSEVARYYALAATFVSLHLIALALYTGSVRVKNKKWVNPEDAKFNKGEKVDVDAFAVARVKAAHMNLLENAVPFLVIGALYTTMANPSKTGALAYFGTFVGARVLHSFVYIAGKQPFRTICFVIGMLATVGMAVHVVRAAL